MASSERYVYLIVDSELGYPSNVAGKAEPAAFVDEHQAQSYVNDEPYLRVEPVKVCEKGCWP